jgi:hypothetical protein
VQSPEQWSGGCGNGGAFSRTTLCILLGENYGESDRVSARVHPIGSGFLHVNHHAGKQGVGAVQSHANRLHASLIDASALLLSG